VIVILIVILCVFVVVQGIYFVDSPAHQAAHALGHAHRRATDTVEQASGVSRGHAEQLADCLEVEIRESRRAPPFSAGGATGSDRRGD
jgi:hypothetical protein